MSIIIHRDYVSASQGFIGRVKLDVYALDSVGNRVPVFIDLDGRRLPRASAEHLINFAGQTLQDAYAGKGSDSRAFFIKKYDKLLAGNIGIRESHEAVDEFTYESRLACRAALKRSNKSVWKALRDMSEEDSNAALDSIIADENTPEAVAFGQVIREIAQDEVEAKARKRQRMSKLGGVKVNLPTIFAEVSDDEDESEAAE